MGGKYLNSGGMWACPEVEKEAPYDRCIMTAAGPEIPPPIINQLKEGGIIIAPIGYGEQKMIRGVKRKGDKAERGTETCK